ncbi:Ldh family oxidoreductase [Cupriavidus basilensis]
MVGQRTPPVLGMEGFAGPAIGHNPIAFGCPLPGQPPIVFDVACSVAARGHILLAAREGKPIPEGWALDAEGQPTTDAQRALAGSAAAHRRPQGDRHRHDGGMPGGALAATADSLSPERNHVGSGGAVGRQGGFVWLVKPGAFAGQGVFADYMAQWTGNYPAAGGDDARLPGHRGDTLEHEGREHGIALSDAITRELGALGRQPGHPLSGLIHPHRHCRYPGYRQTLAVPTLPIHLAESAP